MPVSVAYSVDLVAMAPHPEKPVHALEWDYLVEEIIRIDSRYKSIIAN